MKNLTSFFLKKLSILCYFIQCKLQLICLFHEFVILHLNGNYSNSLQGLMVFQL